MIRTLELGGVAVPLLASTDLEQTYEEIGGYTVLRMMSGAAVPQQHWAKLSTQVTGSGILPAGLDALDCSQPMTMKCVAARAICSVSNIIVLPATRRADYAPVGHAVLPDGRHQVTPLALAGNTATLTAVAGAVSYLALYWPQLTVVVTSRPRSRTGARAGTRGWELTAEEV